MPKLTITDEQVDAYVVETHGEGIERNTPVWRAAKKHLAQQNLDAAKANTPPAAQPAHLTVTVEIALGGQVIGVSSQAVPIPKGITAP